MSSTVMLLGILAAFVLLGYMCMKGWSVYISAPLCAIIIALTSGMGPLNAITESFLPGTGNYLAQWFGLFMLGALFGKIMETSGAAASIAHSVTKLIGAGKANLEHFVPNEKDLAIMEANKNRELPHIAVSLLPLLVVVCSIIFLKWNTMVCLLLGIVVSIVLYFGSLKGVFMETVNQGALNSTAAIMNTSLTVGLGAVVKASPAFSIITDAVDKLAQGNGLIYEFISINILAGVTGSASGGLSIALTTLSERLLATGINPEILHRVASISANGLDSMPWCGAVMTMFAVCGVTHKDSYKDVAVVNIVITMTGAILAILLDTMGIC